MSANDLLTPLVGQIGIGGVGGFLVGYALKKFAKLVAIFLGLGFVVLQYLAYVGVIAINYGAMKDWALSIVGQASGLGGAIYNILANLPFGASFVIGLYLGIKKG